MSSVPTSLAPWSKAWCNTIKLIGQQEWRGSKHHLSKAAEKGDQRRWGPSCVNIRLLIKSHHEKHANAIEFGKLHDWNMYIYTHIYIRTHVHIHIHACTYTYTCTYTYSYTHTYYMCTLYYVFIDYRIIFTFHMTQCQTHPTLHSRSGWCNCLIHLRGHPWKGLEGLALGPRTFSLHGCP